MSNIVDVRDQTATMTWPAAKPDNGVTPLDAQPANGTTAPAVETPDTSAMIADVVSGVITRRVQCPADLFGEGRYIILRPMKTKTQIQVRGIDHTTEEGMHSYLVIVASLIADWNVVDPWTGESMKATAESVGELESNQWIWLGQEITGPKRQASAQNSSS